jgi:hypothetical protein
MRGVIRRVSLVTAVLVPVAFALVANLATGTVQVSAWWWPWAVWSASSVLVVATVIIELRQRHTGEHAPPGAGALDEPAAQLAEAVRAQWRDEEDRRRVHDPFPLPLRWGPAAAGLADHWANIRRAPAGTDPGPLLLAGSLDQIAGMYRRIPSGRLVVLGRAGAGKTSLAVRFLLDMLATRSSRDPVPVVFGLGSWNPPATSLRDWLAGELLRGYPALAAPALGGMSLAAALVQAGRILPVLDGFDEIGDGLHGSALKAVNATRMPLLLTSRSKEYAAAVTASDVLTAAAVIELDGLTVADLDGYLPRTARPVAGAGHEAASSAATAWAPVLARLRPPEPDPAARALLQVLATPLMITLARAIYSDNPERDPADLLDTDRFRSPRDLENHLLGAFIPAVYQNQSGDQRPGSRYRRCQAARAERWLGYLAWHLDQLRTRDLALWQLGDTVPRLAAGLMAGAAVTVMSWLGDLLQFGPVLAMFPALISGGAAGLCFAYGSRRRPSRAELRLRGTAAPFMRRFAAGAAAGMAGGLALGMGPRASLVISVAAGLAFGSYVWLHTPAIISAVPTPSAVLRQDCVATLTFALAAALMYATVCTLELVNAPAIAAATRSPLGVTIAAITSLAAGGIAGSVMYGPVGGIVYGTLSGAGPILSSLTPPHPRGLSLSLGTALAAGAILGLAFALAVVLPRAWGTWTASRILLALHGDLPFRLMPFLEDARRRGVLRQSGGVYQFGHARLQDHLGKAYRDAHARGASRGRHARPFRREMPARYYRAPASPP